MTKESVLRRLLPRSVFGRDVAILAGGAGVAQVIAIAAAPILTRLFTPEDFGILAVYTAMIGIVGVIASGQYHQAIPLPEEKSVAANLFALSMILILVVALISTLLFIPYAGAIATFVGVPGLAPYVWLIPLGIAGLASYEVTSTYAIRNKAFGLLARTRLVQGVGQSGTQLGTGFGGVGAVGLLLGQLMGQTLGTGSLAWAAWRSDRSAFRAVSPRGMITAASRFKRFPLLWSWCVIFNTLGGQSPALLLSYFFGPAVVGLFALAERIAGMPLMLIAKSASQVFFAQAADAHRDSSLGRGVEELILRMFRTGLPFFPIVILAAPQVVSVVFGSDWRESGVYIQYLSPWLFMLFVGFPLTPVVKVVERQDGELLFQFFLFLGRVGSIVAGGLLESAKVGVALFGSVSALIWVVYLSWIVLIAGARWPLKGSVLMRPIALATVIGAVLGLTVTVSPNDEAVVAVAVVCGLAAALTMRRNSQELSAPGANEVDQRP